MQLVLEDKVRGKMDWRSKAQKAIKILKRKTSPMEM